MPFFQPLRFVLHIAKQPFKWLFQPFGGHFAQMNFKPSRPQQLNESLQYTCRAGLAHVWHDIMRAGPTRTWHGIVHSSRHAPSAPDTWPRHGTTPCTCLASLGKFASKPCLGSCLAQCRYTAQHIYHSQYTIPILYQTKPRRSYHEYKKIIFFQS